MAHKVVRTRSNQRLVYLNGDRTAPIATEKLARPYGQQEKAGFDHESDQSKRGCVRKKARAKAGDRKEEQKLRRSDQSEMNAARGPRFLRLGVSCVFGGDFPIQRKQD
jgi:hypothetical protein